MNFERKLQGKIFLEFSNSCFCEFGKFSQKIRAIIDEICRGASVRSSSQITIVDKISSWEISDVKF